MSKLRLQKRILKTTTTSDESSRRVAKESLQDESEFPLQKMTLKEL